MQAFKDPMHRNKHGNNMLALKCRVLAVRDFEVAIGLRPDTLVKRLKGSLLGLCYS